MPFLAREEITHRHERNNDNERQVSSVKCVAELESLRDKSSRGMYIRNLRHNGIRVVVSMGTCGLACGAREVLCAILEEVELQQSEIQVSIGQCAGDCIDEPLFTVFAPGQQPRTHVKMTPEQSVDVIRKLGADRSRGG